MEEIFNFKNIIIYILVINLITFLVMYIDKQKAKKQQWRIKEGTLMMLAVCGGSIGGILGMHIFRHKIKKLKFVIGFPTILISEIVLIIYLLIKF